MFQSMRHLSLAAAALVMALPASAQSSLGLSRLEAEIGISGDGSQDLAEARISGDFRITGAHGLQIDLSAFDYPGGYLGQIDGHLYLQPGNRSKYGLFGSLADVDGREATIAFAGAEGLFALTGRTTLETRAGIGYARPGALDFVAAEARLSQAVTGALSVHVAAQVAEIQEQSLDTRAWGAEIGLTWHPAEGPLAITAAAGTTGLDGRDSVPADGYIRLGVSWSFGGGSDARRPVAEHGFTSPRPFDPLLRRGRF